MGRVFVMEKGCCGYCSTCNCEHSLPVSPAREPCLELMNLLQREKRIDFTMPTSQADLRYSTDYLEGPARGKMFGVMIARTAGGRQRLLRAFSGQYNGIWKVPGWVDPVFDLTKFHKVHDSQEKEIKELGVQIQEAERRGPACQSLTIKRKHKSQQLMKKIHELYRLKNFCSQEVELAEIFSQGRGIPTGTGDCCAPKLLQYAAVNNLRPVSIAEFYWGRENLSGTRHHGSFYPSCQSKCYPILGFMLCGLTPEHND